MIEITDDAKKELKKILAENAEDPNMSLRLTMSEEGGLGLMIDEVMPDDNIVEYEGTRVLVIEETIALLLDGVSIEVEQTPEGQVLTLKHSGGCSCCGGESDCCGESGCSGNNEGKCG